MLILSFTSKHFLLNTAEKKSFIKENVDKVGTFMLIKQL